MVTKTKWSFLTEEHISKCCRPGKGRKTCRYLTMCPDGWDCEKSTSMGQLLDEDVKTNTIVAQGNNCPGVIGFLCEGKLIGELKGKKVFHEESTPPYQVIGTIKELFVSDGILYLKAKWEDGKEFTPAIALSYLTLDSRGDRIVVSTTFPGGNTWTFYPN